MPAPPDTEVPVMKALVAADRCDRCGARASVVTEHAGMRLLWCSHHFTAHESELVGFVVLDQREHA